MTAGWAQKPVSIAAVFFLRRFGAHCGAFCDEIRVSHLTNPQPLPSNVDMDAQLSNLKFDSAGLIPAIIQDARTGEVLMMAWMNQDSLDKTIQIGKTHFFSRSRGKLWLKGESSGHVQTVKSISVDCDQDVLLIKVEQVGAACHEGYYSCFFREYQKDADDLKIVGKRVFEPEKVYGK
jgi:phosphoribosyl-AMP cyclohydrolase